MKQDKIGVGRVVTAAVVGTLIEWYDFFVYASVIGVVAALFFPSGDPMASILLATIGFGVGYVSRPIGGIVFGHFGDKYGRKIAFVFTVLIMGLATFAIGLLPTYEQVGILAPTLLMILRLLQGFSVGGEWAGAVTYAAEFIRPERRGFLLSMIPASATFALAITSLFVYALRVSLPPQEFLAWGWRVPFLFSIVLVAVALYVRLRVLESPVFAQLKTNGNISKLPIKDSIKLAGKPILLAALVTAGATTIWYSAHITTQVYITSYLKLPATTLLQIMSVAFIVAGLIYIFVAGYLADRWGRRNTIRLGLILATILVVPFFYILTSIYNEFIVFLSVLILLTFTALSYGPYGAYFPELFEPKIRYTAVSLSYQIPIAYLGGFTPTIMTWILLVTGIPAISALWVALTCLLGAIAIQFLPETKGVAK